MERTGTYGQNFNVYNYDHNKTIMNDGMCEVIFQIIDEDLKISGYE